MKHLNNLYLIIGESGSGKDTVINDLCDTYSLDKVVSYTTRPKRNDDYGKKTHVFVSEQEVNNLCDIVALTHFDNYTYCGTQQQVDNADFYIIDKQGILYFKEHYKGDRPYRIIYITAPEFVRGHRMTCRGDEEKNVRARLEHDKLSFHGVENLADYTANNIVLQHTINDVWNYIMEEESKNE